MGLGVGRGSFWNVNLGLLKKVRTASDKFITRLNLIMSCSRALSPLSPSLHLPSLLPSVFLCFFNKHTDSSTLRCSPENCEVHAHSDVTKKDVTPHFLKKKKTTVASPPLKLQPPTISRYPSFVFFSLCDGKCFKGKFTQASGYTRSPVQ